MKDSAQNVRRARFYKGNGRSATTTLQTDDFLEVDFNPTALKHSVNRANAGAAQGRHSQQYSRQTETSLSMELLFDSTPTGEDVRKKTEWLAQRISGSSGQASKKQEPPLIIFEWGTYQFSGVLTSFSETLDYFAAEGIPLRASVSITLEGRDAVRSTEGAKAEDWKLNLDEGTVVATAVGQSVTSLANRAGVQDTGRGLATQNGEENMRLPQRSSLVLDRAGKLNPPLPFVPGTSSEPKPSGAPSRSDAGSAAIGLPKSAGVAASEGAFAFLRSPPASGASSPLDGSAILLRRSGDQPLPAEADFSLGGRAATGAAATGLRARVGAGLRLSDCLRFEEE